MAKKITPEQISQMIDLYSTLGTYSAVAKQLGISASTVSRYIKESQNTKIFNDGPAPKPIEEIDFKNVITFSELTNLEKQSYINWLKEFNLHEFCYYYSK